MSKKTPTSTDSSFGEFDAWFDAKPDVDEPEAVVEFVADPKEAAAKEAAAKKVAEAEKKAEESKRASDAAAKRSEDQKRVEEARRVQMARLAEEAKQAEALRAQEEARRTMDAKAKAEDDQRIARERQAAEETRRVEEARLAEEARRVAAEREAVEAAERAAAAAAEQERQAAEAERRRAEDVAARAAAVEAAARAAMEEEAARIEAARIDVPASPLGPLPPLEEEPSETASAPLNQPVEAVAVGVAGRRPAPAVIRVGAAPVQVVSVDDTPTLSDFPLIPAATDGERVSDVPAPAVDAAAGEGSWEDAARVLEREAIGAARAQRLFEAARVVRTRLGAPARALRLLTEAEAVGGATAATRRERALCLEATGDRGGAGVAWRQVALDYNDAEALRTAAAIAVDTGSIDPDLIDALAADGQDPRSLRLLIALRRQQGAVPELIDALGRLGAVLGGGEAADVLAEQARLLEREGRVPEAVAAWSAVRAADPDHPGALNAIDLHLRAAGDYVALAELYRAEGERLAAGAGRALDAAWWYGRSARIYREKAFNSTAAVDGYQRALALAPLALGLRRELEQQLTEASRWDDLADSIRAEIAASAPEDQGFLQFRLGRVLYERKKDAAGALAAWKAASEDPAAAPAAEAVLRLLQDQKDWEGLIRFLDERVSRLDDPGLHVTGLYRAGETCEGPLQDQQRAKTYYERVIDVAPGYLPALEGLERVYMRLEAWPQLATVYEQRALLAEDPQGVALHRQRAGSVYDIRLKDTARAAEQYRLALEAVPDFPPSLDAYARVLERNGDWSGLGHTLRRAAEVTREGNEAVSLYYRAGRVLADCTGETDAAMACLRRCIDRSPGFLPAILLLKDLAWRTGAWEEIHRIERAQADVGGDVDRRHWRLLAAAEFAPTAGDPLAPELVEEVLREDPTLAAAVSMSERVVLAGGAGAAATLPAVLRRADESADAGARARLGSRAAELALEASDVESFTLGAEVALTGDPAGVPARALARAALQLDQGDLVPRLLGHAGLTGTSEAVRLGAPLSVASDLLAQIRNGDTSLAAAVIRDGGESKLLAEAHLALAAGSSGVAAGVHAEAAGRAMLASGNASGARAAYELAIESGVSGRGTRDGLIRSLVAVADVPALKQAFKHGPRDEAEGLGEALESAGDHAGAITAWTKAMGQATDPMAISLRIERAQAAAGDWRGVFETLSARMPRLSPEGKAEASARCRWLLAERLADSDEAWDFYRRLHDANPEDLEVLESLARIAGARGETGLAVNYLGGLAQRAETPREGARYHRRVAEAYERSGQSEQARAAYGRALDLLPEDLEALGGIRRLSEAAGDWQAVVGVLARTAALSSGSEQIDRFAEIARIWEEKLDERAVAADAWRKVLELAPEDPEALRHLVSLSEAARAWGGFVQYAQELLPFLEGPERVDMMRRVGTVMAEHLRREEEAVRFLESATAGDAPDSDALKLLERIHTGRGDWERVVEVLLRRGRVGPLADRTEALSKAARIKTEQLRDRDGAAAIYGELLAVAPDAPEALRNRSDFLWESGDYPALVEVYARMEAGELARDTDDFDTQVEVATFCFRFGEALRRVGRIAEATSRYERALELNPNHLPSLEAVGPLYMDAGEWRKADKVWKQVLQLSAGSGSPEQLSRTHASLGSVEFKLGLPDKARKRFAKALELRPNDIGALRGLGEVLFAAGDWHNLLNIYNNIIYHTQNPADVIDAYLQKGFVLDARLDLPEKASQHYQKSLAFNPGQPLVLLRLAELALRRTDWPEAASLAERGLQLTVDLPQVRGCLLLVRAIAFQAAGDNASAREGYQEALKLDAWLDEHVGITPIEDHESVHEALRARLQSAARI